MTSNFIKILNIIYKVIICREGSHYNDRITSFIWHINRNLELNLSDYKFSKDSLLFTLNKYKTELTSNFNIDYFIYTDKQNVETIFIYDNSLIGNIIRYKCS